MRSRSYPGFYYEMYFIRFKIHNEFTLLIQFLKIIFNFTVQQIAILFFKLGMPLKIMNIFVDFVLR